MRKFVCIWMCLMAILCGLNSGVGALDMDDIFFEEVPVVITAGRTEQKATEASASVYVISAEDIKQAGIVDVPEALRLAPGVNVTQTTAGSYHVNMREVNYIPGLYILTMIDGHVIYAEGQGETIWESLPIVIEEIDRIEIVRSPGSVLYGANAYSGMINIITKKAEDMDGGLVSVTGGEHGALVGSVIYSGKSSKVNYRISAGYDKVNQMDADQLVIPTDMLPETEVAKEQIKGSLLLDYSVNEDSKLIFQGGISDGTKEQTHRTLYGWMKQTVYLASFGYESPDLKLKVYQRAILRPTEDGYSFLPQVGPTGMSEAVKHCDMYLNSLELQHTIHAGDMNDIVWGAQAQQKQVVTDTGQLLTSDDITQNLWAVYAQDMFKASDKLTITPAVRYDYHPLMEGQLSYKLGAVFSPDENSNLRALYSKAFRAPTFNESYLEYYVMGMLYAAGSEDLDPMTIESIEVGYNTMLSNRIKVDIALFQNTLVDFMYFDNTVMPVTETNDGEARGVGGEICFDVLLNSWLTGKLNYSYAEMEVTEESAANWGVAQTPRNKVNLGLNAQKDALSANINAHYVGEGITWLTGNWGGTNEPLDAYTVVNARVGYEFREGAEIAVSGFNLLGEHYEYDAMEIARKVMGSLSYKF